MTTLAEHRVVPATGAGPGAPARHLRTATLLVVALLVMAGAASVLVGSRALSPAEVVAAVTDAGHPVHGVVTARVARTVLALAVGAALGLAGALLQGLTRNPLADPGLLGVNAGACLAMVVAMSTLGVSALTGYVWFAFAGAAVAMVLVHAVAAIGRGGATPVKLAIAGAALTAALTSWTSGVLLTDKQTVDAFRLWQVGTVGGRGYEVLVVGLPFLLLGTVLALVSAGTLNALALGDDLARGLGRQVWRDRLVIGAAVVLLAGSATALAGPVAFVGLIVPHAVRAATGPDYGRVLPLSLAAGALLVVAADTVGRVVHPPSEVQVGIMTAVLGAPVFLWLVRRGRTAAL